MHRARLQTSDGQDIDLLPHSAAMTAPPLRPQRRGMRRTQVWDAICVIICLIAMLVGVRSIVGGIATRQPAPITAGVCMAIIGGIGVINRLSYRPLYTLSDEIPFVLAFQRRPWLLVICLACEVMAFESYFIWPSASGPYW